MPSERIQRQIDRLLDDADAAANANDWSQVADKARAVLASDDVNEDAREFLKMAEANLGASLGWATSPTCAPGRVGSTWPA